MENNIVLSVKCPHCGTSLMDETTKVNGHPGIKLNIVTDHDRGVLWLCPIYGCFAHKSKIKFDEGEIVKMYCPHCNKQLGDDVDCKLCGAPLVSMNINVGGKVDICSRSGCTNHYVVFEDLNDALSLFYDRFDNIKK